MWLTKYVQLRTLELRAFCPGYRVSVRQPWKHNKFGTLPDVPSRTLGTPRTSAAEVTYTPGISHHLLPFPTIPYRCILATVEIFRDGWQSLEISTGGKSLLKTRLPRSGAGNLARLSTSTWCNRWFLNSITNGYTSCAVYLSTAHDNT